MKNELDSIKQARKNLPGDIKTKALQAIEIIALNSDSENQTILSCYAYAHVALGVCSNPHEDWVGKINTIINQEG